MCAIAAVFFKGFEDGAKQITIDKVKSVALDLCRSDGGTGKKMRRGQIFISYRVDVDKEFVRKLYMKLRDELARLDIGFAVWWDAE